MEPTDLTRESTSVGGFVAPLDPEHWGRGLYADTEWEAVQAGRRDPLDITFPVPKEQRHADL